MSFPINFENVFISISPNILNIELKEDLNMDKSKNFKIGIQIYLAFEREYKDFIVIVINLNIVKKDDEEYFYNEDDLYLKSNNIKYYNIIQMKCIYNYCAFYLRSKAINNFFLKIIFKLIKKVYRKKEIRYQIFIIKTTIYRTFILSFKYLLIYIKEEIILKRY